MKKPKERLARFSKFLVVLFFALSLSGCSSDDWICWIPFLCADEEVRLAIDSGDPGECEKLSNPDDSNKELSRKNECFQRIAQDKDDPQVCKMIVGDENRWNNCFRDVAADKKDESLCEEIQNSDRTKADCFVDVAISKGDYTLCDKADGDFSKNRCITDVAIGQEDVSVCQEISNKNTKTNCIDSVALATKDFKVCVQHEYSGDRDDCFDYLANQLNDVSICHRIDEEDDYAGCVSDIALKNGDPSICENSSMRAQDSDWCLKEVAIKNEDVSICDRMSGNPDEYYYDQNYSDCYTKIASKNGNGDLCLSMRVLLSARPSCILDASKKGQDSSSCNNLDSSDDKYKCVTNVAFWQRDAVHCANVLTDQKTREDCIKEVAKRFKTEDVCQNIIDPGDKEICIANLPN